MQYFNKNNSEVEYIKDLLRTTYIPTCRIFSGNTNIQPESQSSNISYMTEEDELTSEQNNSRMFKNETIVYDNSVKIGVEDGSKGDTTIKTKYLQKYDFGKWYKNYTTNYISNRNYYDSNLHEWLGRYLRAYRDYYRIDVMNFYNCFSCRYLSEYSLPIPSIKSKSEEAGLRFQAADINYTLTAFPILWDTKYKVKFYTSSLNNVEIQAVYFNGSSIIGAVEFTDDLVDGEHTYTPKTYKLTGVTEFEIMIGSQSEDYVATGETADGTTIYSTTDLADGDLKYRYSRQNLLYLFMQYPSNVDCPIVVIEQPKFTSAINNELLNLPSDNHQQIAFCDILLEYLTGSVITPSDKISANIHRVQNIVSSEGFYKEYGVGGPMYLGVDLNREKNGYPSTYKFPAGVYDETLHRIIYEAFFNNGRDKVAKGLEEPVKNFIGYVDSDIEKRLNKVAVKYNLEEI